MTTPLRIGIAGIGTVGCATINLIAKHGALLQKRAGRAIEITAVSARNPAKERPINKACLNFMDDPLALASSSNVDVVVELIGGDSGIAKTIVETALTYGKPVVTANKALIAHHGLELAELAEKHGVLLAFEAAVAGGIPAVKTIRESLSGNQASSIHGILNGTSNYMLSEMSKTGREFDDILKEAQDKGYAEADPAFDIDGIDAAHKLAILSSIAFGITPQMSSISTEGIRNLSPVDTAFAAQHGYTIKLLGSAIKTADGVRQIVCPYLVPQSCSLAHVNGVLNAVSMDADMVGNIFLQGPGAGGDATASSVVADLIDIARGVNYYAFGIPAAELSPEKPVESTGLTRCYYLRMSVNDDAGTLADITRICHGNNISLDVMQQPHHAVGEVSSVVMTTHPTTENAIRAACAAIGVLPSVITQPQPIRIMS